MSNFSGRIKSLRTERGITQEQLASMLKVSRSTIGMYESGKREPDFETSEAIADIFNVDMDYLTGRSDIERKHPITPAILIPTGCEPLPRTVKVPLVGTIACGQPITAEQNIEDYIDAPKDIRCDFCLRCQGDSMVDAGIRDGDIVYVQARQQVENGEIAVVCIDGEATLKRVYWNSTAQTLQLVPANSAYMPLVYTGSMLDNVRIEGKAVGYLHWF